MANAAYVVAVVSLAIGINGNANVAHGYEPADGMGGMGGSM